MSLQKVYPVLNPENPAGLMLSQEFPDLKELWCQINEH